MRNADDDGHTCVGRTDFQDRVALDPTHPLYLTHAHVRRTHPAYVRFVGKLPRRPGPNDRDSLEAQAYYAFVLSVFKAYRTQPVPPGSTLRDAYEDWSTRILPGADPEYADLVHALLDNIEEDHASADRRTEEAKRLRSKRRRVRDDTEYPADEDEGEFPLEDMCGAAGDEDLVLDGMPVAVPVLTTDLSAIADADLFDRTRPEGAYAYHAARCLPDAVLTKTSPRTQRRGYVRMCAPGDVDDIKAVLAKLKAYRTTSSNSPEANAATVASADFSGTEDSTRRMVLRRDQPRRWPVYAVLHETRNGVPSETVIVPGQRPPYVQLDHEVTIEETVQLFNLSVGQAVPFMLMAQAFVDRNTYVGMRPTMKIVGKPGAGKSQLIHAMLWFTYQRGRPLYLRTCAYAWAAAVAFTTEVHRSLSTHNMFQLLPVPPDTIRTSADASKEVRNPCSCLVS